MKRFLSSLFALAVSATPALALSQSASPPKFGIPWANSAGVPYIRSIPVPSQIGIQNCAASLTDGWPPLTFTPAGAGGCPPFGADFNGILKQITQWSQWQSAGGPVFFDAGFAASANGYPNGAKLMSAITPGTVWMSTADNNSTNPDSSSAANWVQDPGQIPIGTPIQSLSTTIPYGYVSANGLTVGNASSNATNRANADTQFLFNFIWINCPNTICPIYTSAGSASTRGATPWADFADSKAIAVANTNGKGFIGADSQGGTTSTNLLNVPVSLGSRTAPWSVIGENFHTLNLTETPTGIQVSGMVTVNLPAGLDAPYASIGTTGSSPFAIAGSIFAPSNTGGPFSYFTSMAGVNTLTSSNTGGGPHNTVEFSTVTYWNLKL